jgi:hypothetical protein
VTDSFLSPTPFDGDNQDLLFLGSYVAVVYLFQLNVSPLAIIDTIQRDLRNFGAIIFHGDPEEVIHISRAILVPRSTGRTHSDIVAAMTLLVVVIM